jgi:hypothetical protein
MLIDFVLFGVMVGQMVFWAHGFAKERRFVRIVVVGGPCFPLRTALS